MLPARLRAPKPRPLRRYLLDAFAFPKRCGCCKREHGTEAWAALKFIGVQTFEVPGDPETADIPPLELRNCVCGTTLGLEIVP